jgi:hypothetical protein
MHEKKHQGVDPYEVMQICTWCGKKISPDSEVFALGVRARPEVDLKSWEGGVMQILLTTIGKTVFAIVPTDDSQARQEGKDLMLTVCCQRCGDALKRVLQEEIDIVDAFI